MVNEFIKSIWLILPVTIVTMVLEAVAVKHMQSTQNSSIASTMSSFLISGLVFGFVAIFAYHKIEVRWPENPAQTYLWIALAIGIILSVFAIAFRSMVKADWIAALMWILMNFLWAGGYGVFLPRILNSIK
jgi:cytochrome bd-type quinol oxidase subunit 2